MDYIVCSNLDCGKRFPRFEEVVKDGRQVEVDWSIEDRPLCPECRGLPAPEMPKRDVLGGFPPGRRARIVPPTAGKGPK